MLRKVINARERNVVYYVTDTAVFKAISIRIAPYRSHIHLYKGRFEWNDNGYTFTKDIERPVWISKEFKYKKVRDFDIEIQKHIQDHIDNGTTVEKELIIKKIDDDVEVKSTLVSEE